MAQSLYINALSLDFIFLPLISILAHLQGELCVNRPKLWSQKWFYTCRTNIFLRKLFPQFLFAIFRTWVLLQISDVSQERGSGHCILDQEDTGFGGLNGGDIKIAPQNRFARLKKILVIANLRSHKLSFLRNLLFLEENGFFWEGGSIEGTPKMVLARFHVFLQYQKQEPKFLNQESNARPDSIVLS